MAVPQMQKMGALGSEVAKVSQTAITDVEKAAAARTTADAAKMAAEKDLSSGAKAVIGGVQSLSSLIQAGSGLWETMYKAPLVEAQADALKETTIASRAETRRKDYEEADKQFGMLRKEFPGLTFTELKIKQQGIYQERLRQYKETVLANPHWDKGMVARKLETMNNLAGTGATSDFWQKLGQDPSRWNEMMRKAAGNKIQIELDVSESLKKNMELLQGTKTWPLIKILQSALPDLMKSDHGQHQLAALGRDLLEEILSQGVNPVTAEKVVINSLGETFNPKNLDRVNQVYEQELLIKDLNTIGENPELIKGIAKDIAHMLPKQVRDRPVEWLLKAYRDKDQQSIGLSNYLHMLARNKKELPFAWDSNLEKFFGVIGVGEEKAGPTDAMVTKRGGFLPVRNFVHKYLGLQNDSAVEHALLLSGKPGQGRIKGFDDETRNAYKSNVGVPGVGRSILGMVAGAKSSGKDDELDPYESQAAERFGVAFAAGFDTVLTYMDSDIRGGKEARNFVVHAIMSQSGLNAAEMRDLLTGMKYLTDNNLLFNRHGVTTDRSIGDNETAVRSPKWDIHHQKRMNQKISTLMQRGLDQLAGRDSQITIGKSDVRPLLEQGLIDDGFYYDASQEWYSFNQFMGDIGRSGEGSSIGSAITKNELSSDRSGLSLRRPAASYYIGDTTTALTIKNWILDISTGGKMWDGKYGYKNRIDISVADHAQEGTVAQQVAKTVPSRSTAGAPRKTTRQVDMRAAGDERGEGREKLTGADLIKERPTPEQVNAALERRIQGKIAGYRLGAVPKKDEFGATGLPGMIKPPVSDPASGGHESDIYPEWSERHGWDKVEEQRAGFIREKSIIEDTSVEDALKLTGDAPIAQQQNAMNAMAKSLNKALVAIERGPTTNEEKRYVIMLEKTRKRIAEYMQFAYIADIGHSDILKPLMKFNMDPANVLDTFERLLEESGYTLPPEEVRGRVPTQPPTLRGALDNNFVPPSISRGFNRGP